MEELKRLKTEIWIYLNTGANGLDPNLDDIMRTKINRIKELEEQNKFTIKSVIEKIKEI